MSASKTTGSARAATLLLVALGLLGMAYVANAASTIERVQEYPDHPNQCKDRLSGAFFGNGVTWQYDGKCFERHCRFPYINTNYCGVVQVEEPCELVVDSSKRYPDCCPQPRCPSEDLDTNAI